MANLNSLGKLTGGIEPSEKRRKNNHFVFIVCILIAAFFWLLIKLSGDYSESYQFKITYNNAPIEKMLTGIIDTNVNISIKAKGFQMLKLELTEDVSILNINLDKYEIVNSKGNIFYINTSEIKDEIGKLIGISSNQIDISVKRLEFKLEDLFEKEVKVVDRIKFNFAKQYNLYSEITISPKTISIFGPKSIIDTIENVYTENKVVSGISSDINETVKLVNPNTEQLQLSIQQVNIMANVEKFTESNVETTIDLSSIKNKVKAFPNTVKVFFTVAQKDFSNVRQSMFKVKPNLNNIEIKTASKLQLEVVDKPEFVSGIRIQPSEIEFLIIK